MTAEEITQRLGILSAHDTLWCGIAPADGLCSLCRGAGSLMCYQDGKREFWECPACSGVGARVLFGRPTVTMRAVK